MGVYKKSHRWYIDYYLPGGKRRREVVTIPKVDPSNINRLDAEKALSIRKAEIAQGKFNISQTKPQVLFKKLCNRYLDYSKNNKRSWTRDQQSINHFLKHFKNKTLQQINPWVIEKYKSERMKEVKLSTIRKEVIKPSTVNRELDTLRNMLNKAVDWGMIESSPYKGIRHFKVNNINLRIINNEEFSKLYESSSLDLKPILLCAISTGMRLGELLSLKWNDINWNDDYILVRDSKNYESRTIPINATLLKALSDLKKHSESDYVFGGRTTIKWEWTNALKTSGIAHCRFHDLRHSFASRLVMGNVDLVTVKELMGHKRIETTMRYSHPTPEHKIRAVESINFETVVTYLDTNKKIDELSKTSKTNVTVLKR